MWSDFAQQVKIAKADCKLSQLIRQFNGDRNLQLDYLTASMIVLPEAFSKSFHRINSLEQINERAQKNNCEIPFTCLIDEAARIITKTFRGQLGTKGFCSWDCGTLLPRSMQAARASGTKVMLGHTHPAGFGAICSNVYYRRNDEFGGDYLELLGLMKKFPIISQFHAIMSPAENQLGIFQLQTNGRVNYCPWRT